MTAHSDWQAFQDELVKWQVETFGPAPARSVIAHLKREAGELHDDPKDVIEYADCMLLLLGAAARVGYDTDILLDACRLKLKINRAREWGPVQSDGTVEHIPRSGEEG